jgi:CRP/FNR family transcriptional regulator, cyclic AMP receptor protein
MNGSTKDSRDLGTAQLRGLCSRTMARDDYIDHLASVPLFRGMTNKELREIARATVELQVEQGREFVTQGDVGREAFIIVEGTADVVRNGKSIAKLGAGDCVGELALLDHGPRTTSVVAETPLTVLVLGPREFSGLLEEVPTLSRKIMEALASRVRELDSQVFG